MSLILWWLKESALGTLHRAEQPVERVYFDSGAEVILPAGFDGAGPPNTRLALYDVQRGSRFTVVAVNSTEADDCRRPYVPVYLRVERVHGSLDPLPRTLGALVDQWNARGVPLAAMLIERLAAQAGGGVVNVPEQAVLLILDIGITREPGGNVERRESIGFLIQQSVVSLAYGMGAVHRHQLMYFAPSEPSPTAADENAEHWRPINVFPIDVKAGLTRKAARKLAGLSEDGADANRVLIGVGSLGGALADIWNREGWGRWTFVDPDHVLPHNLVRHRAVRGDLGQYKVDVLKRLVDSLFSPDPACSGAIPADATALNNDTLTKALETAELVVDVSTTLDVPRDLSQRKGARRMVSAFMTPSGRASVMLLEDEARTAPLDLIEPQYYRQILRSSWGETHLVGHSGHITVGAGCRDVSTVMSPEIVELHAAILARQIRTLAAQPEAAIRIWIAGEDGSVTMHSTTVRYSTRIESKAWNVVYDDEVIETLRALRAESAPKETGGIIVGYTDHVSRTLYVVDVLAAPSDSLEEESFFVRGTDGLPAMWKQVQEKTAYIVNYIGEWHSHPPRYRAVPSWDDLKLITELGNVLARDGEPMLMIIIAENEHSITICESDGSTTEISAAALIR